jgi:hypothetical protein
VPARDDDLEAERVARTDAAVEPRDDEPLRLAVRRVLWNSLEHVRQAAAPGGHHQQVVTGRELVEITGCKGNWRSGDRHRQRA